LEKTLGTVASQPLIGGRFTTTHVENNLDGGLQRASSILNFASRSACVLSRAHSSYRHGCPLIKKTPLPT
jgi:hypothetical protein